MIRNIKALEQRKSNAMQVYGDKIPILLDAIRKSRFRGPPPLGPVGILFIYYLFIFLIFILFSFSFLLSILFFYLYFFLILYLLFIYFL